MATESDWFVPVEDKQQASDLQPQIVAYSKSADENIVIVQASNGKYFNHYGYDEDSNNFASAAGGFDTFEEAEQTLYAHRPTAIDITEEKQTPMPLPTRLSYGITPYHTERTGNITMWTVFTRPLKPRKKHRNMPTP